MKKYIRVILILVIVILTLSIVRIFVSNKISTSGVVLGKIQEEVDKLKFENTILSEKLYTMSSLTSVVSKAHSIGYIDSKTDFVLNSQVPVAIKQ